MKTRHKNQDHGWSTSGVRERGIKMPRIADTRKAFAAFEARHAKVKPLELDESHHEAARRRREAFLRRCAEAVPGNDFDQP